LKLKSLKTLLYLEESNCDFGVHKSVGIPRATMWSHVDEIEKEIGIKLINRHKRHSSFTKEGLAFLPYIRDVHTTLEHAKNKFSQPQTANSKIQIVISTTKAVVSGWMIKSLKTLHSKHPNFTTHITSNDYLSKKEEVASDIMIRPLTETNHFEKKWYIPYQHGLFASKEYLERMGTPKTPQDLQNHCLIGYGEHEFSHFSNINWHLKGMHPDFPKLKPDFTVNSSTSVFLAAKEGIGICSAPVEPSPFFESSLVRVLPHIDGPCTKTFFCVNKNVNPTTKKNIEIFENFFKAFLKHHNVTIQKAE
jgi:DNA-binding transcriptional LysR family regulator